MKLFLVELELQIGEYQKHVKKLVRALHPESAGKSALMNECHHDFGDGAEMQGVDVCEDDYGGMIYTVYIIKEVDPEHEAIVTLYMS